MLGTDLQSSFFTATNCRLQYRTRSLDTGLFEFGPNHLSMGTEATQIGYFTPADRDLDHVQRIRNRDCTAQCRFFTRTAVYKFIIRRLKDLKL